MDMNIVKTEVEEDFYAPEQRKISDDVVDGNNQTNAYSSENSNASTPIASDEKPYSLPLALSQHFSVQQQVGDGTISGICHSCGAVLKFTIRATSNLITHLKRCDSNRYEVYCQSRKCKRQRRSSPVSLTSMAASYSAALDHDEPSPKTAVSVVNSVDYTSLVANNGTAGTKPIMKHFKMVGLTPCGKITACCLYCGVDVRASVKATSNLISHLRRCSQTGFEEYCRDRTRNRVPQHLLGDMVPLATASHDGHHSFSAGHQISSPSNRQPMALDDVVSEPPSAHSPSDLEQSPSMNSKFSFHQMFGAPQSKQRNMVKSLVLTAASDHVPYETILKPNLKQFLTASDSTFAMPDLHTMNDVIVPICAQKLEEKITSEMQHFRRVYLGLSLWIDSESVSHAAFHVKFINENWELVSRYLGTYSSKTKLKASSLTSALADITKKYKIDSKVKSVLADNALPFLQDCSPMFPVSSQNYSTNISDNDFSTLKSFLPTSIPSAGERIRLCATDALIGDDMNFSPVSAALRKAMNLMSAVTNSSAALKLLAQNRVRLRPDIDLTGWMSPFEAALLITENLQHVESTLNILEAPNRDSLKLTVAEITILREVVRIFGLLLVSGRSLEVERFFAILPVVNKLKSSLDSIDRSRYVHCDDMLLRLKSSVKKRLGVFLHCDDVTVASFLDPRLKLICCDTKKDRDDFLVKMNGLVKLFCNSIDGGYTFTDTDTVGAACQYYLSEPLSPPETDILLYWKCCPSTLMPLALLAREILPCVINSFKAETLSCLSAVEKCYHTFSHNTELCERLTLIDRNKSLFTSSL